MVMCSRANTISNTPAGSTNWTQRVTEKKKAKRKSLERREGTCWVESGNHGKEERGIGDGYIQGTLAEIVKG